MSPFDSLRSLTALAALLAISPCARALEARVLADEILTTTTVANNGSSPTWCVGAPLVVRERATVWASISVNDEDAAPYCNTHWELWRRPADGRWSMVREGAAASEREPCPLVRLDDRSLVLSIHPKLLARQIDSGGELSWFCQPAFAVFDPVRDEKAPKLWMPAFGPSAPFTQHSYRSVAVDGAGAMFLLVIDHDGVYHPTWRAPRGVWHPLSPLNFPIRACYPNIGMRNGAAHVLAIGDIKEPNADWKAEKSRVLKRNWDYAFRRLFYTWSPNLAEGGLRTPVEIDSVDDTAGWMFNLDLLIDAQNRVHLLWVRRTFEHGFLRDRFFPGQPNVESVVHAVVVDGVIVARETLVSRTLEGRQTPAGQYTSGRLHELPDGRVLAVLATSIADNDGPGLFLQTLDPNARASAAPVRVAFAGLPLAGWFFTNTTRGGSKPDSNLDLLGLENQGGKLALRYLHVHIP